MERIGENHQYTNQPISVFTLYLISLTFTKNILSLKRSSVTRLILMEIINILMQIAPIKELKDIIKHFIVYEPQYPAKALRFFTDGNPGIIVPLGNYLIPFLNPSLTLKGELIAYGLIDQFINIPAPPTNGLLIIVLQPYGLESISGLPSRLLRNHVFRLSEVPRFINLQLLREIGNLSNALEIIPAIENLFLNTLQGKEPIDPIIKETVLLMQNAQGKISIAELIQQMPVTERNLERKFQKHIGFSPKKLNGILRINHFLKLIRNQQSPFSPLTAALASGYYDQAHLNNQFKSLTGTSPLQYLRNADPLALNLFVTA